MKTQNILRSKFAARELARGARLAALLCLLPAPTRADTVVPEWVRRYDAGVSGDDKAYAVAVDSNGNVFVTGYSDGTGSYNYDYATIKYSSEGIPLWTNRYNGPGNGYDEATAIAVDANGNAFVTGSSFGNGGSLDYATIAYSSAGAPLWTNRYNGPGNGSDVAKAVVVDGNGNVVVTGYSSGSTSYLDYATIAYSNAGVPLWTNRYNGPGNNYDEANAVAVDGSGNVFVTGYSSGNGGSQHYATIAYSSAGVPLWTNRYIGPGNYSDQAQAVAVDGSGNVFVAGSSYNDTSVSSSDYATIGYSSAGVPLWTNRYDGPGNYTDMATGLAVDSSGSVFVTGQSALRNLFPYSYDYATIAYSNAGVPLWTNRYSGSSDDQATDVAVDGCGNVVVTGSSSGSGGYHDYATIAYSSAGVPLWTHRYNGPQNAIDSAFAMAVDRRGNVYVTGRSDGSGSHADFATIKYSVVRPIPLVAQLVEHQLVLSWTNAAFALQCAPVATGPFTNLPSATSPCTNPVSGGQHYFRLISK